MSIFNIIHATLESAIHECAAEGQFLLKDIPSFSVELPREPSHGDLATNVAMMLSKIVGKPPRGVAELLKPILEKKRRHHIC